jgi:hypothetical protein
MKPCVLFFAEDPGAVNFVTPLLSSLSRAGVASRVLASGLAEERFSGAGVDFEPVARDAATHDCIGGAQPSLIAVGTASNPDTPGLALIDYAKRAGIPSIGLVDLPVGAANRFRGNTDDPLAYVPDFVLVPNQWTASEFHKLGLSPDRVRVVGHPHYDVVRSERKRLDREERRVLRCQILPDWDRAKKVVAFATEGSARVSPPPEGYPEDYTLNGRGPGRTEVVLENFLEAVSLVDPRPYVVLRLHPKDEMHDYASYLGAVDFVSHGGSALELAYVSDLVVGLTSMLLLESVLLGRPTLSILPRSRESSWLPSIASGETRLATSKKELNRHLAELLSGGDTSSTTASVQTLPEECVETTVGFITSLVG